MQDNAVKGMHKLRVLLAFTAMIMASVAVVPMAHAAEDKTVAYGETFDITQDTTYSNLVVNGTLNVAEGKKLTCDTFILGDNLDHTPSTSRRCRDAAGWDGSSRPRTRRI